MDVVVAGGHGKIAQRLLRRLAERGELEDEDEDEDEDEEEDEDEDEDDYDDDDDR